MTTLDRVPDAELRALLDRTRTEYEAFRARGLRLDMTRGKPSPEQLDLANGMLTLPGNRDWHTEAGEDARNYGGLQGLPEARALFAPVLGCPPDQVVIGDNSSLALMHDVVAWAMLHGVPGSSRPWTREEAPAFLCPVPGYDRHFTILDAFGIRAIPVPLLGNGPDMDVVEDLVRDPAVKGIWCVPRYSNPTGEIYAETTIRRLAALPAGAPDFRLFWDDAYAVHHLTERRHAIANILDLTAEAGHPDRAFLFASTSKVTLAGAGLALFASSPANVRWFLARAAVRTVGPDKLNQLRHVRFLRDMEGLHRHMDAHRAVVAPRFDAVHDALTARLGGLGIARWTKPEGGYFITVDGPDGTARRVVALAKEAGLGLTPAGATWPGGVDPYDRTLRLAPTYPSLPDVRVAAEGISLCILLAALERGAAARAPAETAA
ncbi:aminotransferase class I/II-fold pyridoxal phosphate-dependent enzyme [Roseomonas sp. CCTCC AB2023176]|uniref:aminotransferase class I/II-fold pyridoxal phosphate-dependent enzyme n=1 Tax=Roseomonas sp. CCTCC AB2023176 TaxID=3342640 RepID=UPI0035D58F82